MGKVGQAPVVGRIGAVDAEEAHNHKGVGFAHEQVCRWVRPSASRDWV